MESNKDTHWSDGLILAAVPALGYWSSYLYELGYCKYFGIPSDFIEISVTSIISAILVLGPILYCLSILFDDIFLVFLAPFSRAIKFSIGRIFIVAAVSIGLSSTLKGSFLAPVLLVLFTTYYELIRPLLSQRAVSGYVAKIEAQRKIDLSFDSSLNWFVRVITIKGLVVAMCFYMSGVIAFTCGGLRARTQTTFNVVQSASEQILLKVYGDQWIVTTFFREEKRISSNFSIVNYAGTGTQLTIENLGQLKPPDEITRKGSVPRA